jgi:hypothetical protein
MGKHHGIQRIAREGDRGVITGYGLLPFSDFAYVHMETDSGETVCLDYAVHQLAAATCREFGDRVVVVRQGPGHTYFEAHPLMAPPATPPGPGGKPKSWALSHHTGPSYGRDST